MPDPIMNSSRRHFLGNCCAAVTATGLLSALAQMRLLGALAKSDSSYVANAAAPDYRALICLFLQGGNDANNLLIPYDDAGYTAYAAARGVLALSKDKLLPITPLTTDGRSWGLHPALGLNAAGATNDGLKKLFDAGKMAMLCNVGTLAYPTTKQQYTAGSIPLPRQLYSHNDQQIEWQSSVSDAAFSTGWGGRLADMVNSLNTNNSVSMSISLAGKNSFQVGSSVAQFNVSTSGAIALSGSSTTTTTVAGMRTSAMNDLMAGANANLFETAFAGLSSTAISDSALVASAISGTIPFTTVFPTSSVGLQMKMIARLIAAAPTLNLKRQVFFAQIGGWDLHDNQVNTADTSTGAHADLIGQVSAAMTAFQSAMTELSLADKVTTFTASDFGRTYNTNGRGSDHGWGSHHFIMGGAVKGGDLYGLMPNLSIGGPDDTGRGRWIPTTSVDEYSARLALWFGVSPTDLPLLLPNINRFNYSRATLGFI